MYDFEFLRRKIREASRVLLTRTVRNILRFVTIFVVFDQYYFLFYLEKHTKENFSVNDFLIGFLFEKTGIPVFQMILCALPFLSRFYSKEIIIEILIIKTLNKVKSLTFINLIIVTAICYVNMMIIINLNNYFLIII